MEERLGKEWFSLLKDEFDRDYMVKLCSFIRARRSENIVYPDKNNVFNAYKMTPFDKVKVCILGQDPYINPGEAHGLAFSTYTGKSTPTLKKIHESVSRQVYGHSIEWTNNLERWTKQGVFLLNTVLTVDAGKSGSHFGIGWEQFTLRSIEELNNRGNVAFLLWGNQAKEYTKYINNPDNLVLACEHPCAASYKNREWINTNCFVKTNNWLKSRGESEINW